MVETKTLTTQRAVREYIGEIQANLTDLKAAFDDLCAERETMSNEIYKTVKRRVQEELVDKLQGDIDHIRSAANDVKAEANGVIDRVEVLEGAATVVLK